MFAEIFFVRSRLICQFQKPREQRCAAVPTWNKILSSFQSLCFRGRISLVSYVLQRPESIKPKIVFLDSIAASLFAYPTKYPYSHYHSCLTLSQLSMPSLEPCQVFRFVSFSSFRLSSGTLQPRYGSWGSENYDADAPRRGLRRPNLSEEPGIN